MTMSCLRLGERLSRTEFSCFSPFLCPGLEVESGENWVESGTGNEVMK